jgi:mono/diheme cytochrome c family protein
MNSRTVGLVIGLVLSCAISASADTESSALFKTKCSSCHTFGRGDLIGPDLKGVNDRHPRPWLIAWIRSSASLISKGDRDAAALFRKYKQQRMPDHALSDAQIVALLDYLAAGGPALDAAPRIRLANTATAEEVVRGQQLFFGATSLASGGLACAACHSVSRHGGVGGTLAADLSDVYTRYLDWALDRKLRQAATHSAGVAENESLALRAFLRSVAVGPAGPNR